MADLKIQNVNDTLCNVCVLALVVSSIVLTKRLQTCAPATETSDQSRERKSILALSITVVILLLLKSVAVGSGRYGSLKMIADGSCHLLALIVAILNLSYLHKINSETCSGPINSTDVHANKNLMLVVIILSGITLVMTAQKGIALLSGKIKGRGSPRSL